jgi:TonB-linked SusC/RagA family outer membrane protein
MIYDSFPIFDKGTAKGIFFTLFLVFCLCASVFSQQKIAGFVKGINDELLGGVTVNVKGSGTGTFTDDKGLFSILVKPGDVLVFSFVGYNSKQITIGSEYNLTVALTESPVNLDKVIVTGYTAQKIKEITGSVASVAPEDLTAVPAGQAEQMLQGRVAGLTVITSGMPGSPSNVFIHGIGNFGNVTPLYIIDGVQGDINLLNPQDIESLQVLKDAGAYAIYGVRGANGVIVVTTRSGKNGKTKITYDSYYGTTRPLRKGLDLLDPQEQANLTWLADRNSGDVDPNTGNPDDPFYGNSASPVLPDILVAGSNYGLSFSDSLANPALYNINPSAGNIYQIVASNKTGTDWFHALFKPAASQNHTVTISSGSEKNKYLLSLGYLDQEGTLLETYLKRYTSRINTVFALDKSIRVGENVQLSFRDNPQITNQSPYNEIFTLLSAWPIMPVYDIKGGWASLTTLNPISQFNPVATREISKNNVANYWDILGNVFAEVNLLRDLTARTSFGGTFNDYYFYTYNLSDYGNNTSTGTPQNSVSETSGYARSWTWTNSLTYSKTFRNIHKITVFAATEAISNFNRELDASRSGFISTASTYLLLSNGNAANQTNSDLEGTSSLYSLIGKADYGFDEKLFFSAMLRKDGSSIFAPGEKYGWFPSISAAWRLAEEKFLKNSKWLTDLKIRTSWGKTGFFGNTNPLNQFDLYGGSVSNSYYDINGTSHVPAQGFINTRIGNPNTTWEQDIVTNIGLESIFFSGKLNLTADWYNKVSSGLLFPVSLPAVLGAAAPPNTNVGNVQNKGLDVLLGSKGNFSKDFNWNATLTFTTYHNKILQLTDLSYFYPATADNYVRNEVGHPVGSFYGYKIIGFFADQNDVNKSPTQQDAGPGRFKYLDANHDGVIDANDQVFFGNPNPKFTMGINLGLIYKGFDFSTFLYGSFGNDVLNIPKTATDFAAPVPGFPFNSAKSKIALYDSWTPTRQNAIAPISENSMNFSNNGTQNSYALENGSYLRNKSMILGYTIKNNWLSKYKIQRLRIYLQCVNLFTLTRYTGLDPELSGASAAWGMDFGNYPNNQKQYLVGLNLSI